MDQTLLLTALLSESLNIFLYVCPPHINTLRMFSFIIESSCRHMVNENCRKRYLINASPIQVSINSLPYSICCYSICVPFQKYFLLVQPYVYISFSAQKSPPLTPPFQFLDLVNVYIKKKLSQ